MFGGEHSAQDASTIYYRATRRGPFGNALLAVRPQADGAGTFCSLTWPRAIVFPVSAAKITIARAARFVGQNAVQLHGGMGMTEELAIGHCFKRLTAIETEFGSATDHLHRYAEVTAD